MTLDHKLSWFYLFILQNFLFHNSLITVIIISPPIFFQLWLILIIILRLDIGVKKVSQLKLKNFIVVSFSFHCDVYFSYQKLRYSKLFMEPFAKHFKDDLKFSMVWSWEGNFYFFWQ